MFILHVFSLLVQEPVKERLPQVMDFHYFHDFLCLCEEMMVIFKAKTTILFFEKSKYTPGSALLFGGNT